jgi:hypothetical protein
VRLGLTPGSPQRKIANVDLASPEYAAYQQNAGQLAKQMVARLITSPGYDELPDDTKAELIGDVFRKTRDVGRAKTMFQYPDLMLRIASEKARKQRPPPRIAQSPVGGVQ